MALKRETFVPEPGFREKCWREAQSWPWALATSGNAYLHYPEGPFPDRIAFGRTGSFRFPASRDGRFLGYVGYDFLRANPSDDERPVFQDFPAAAFFAPEIDVVFSAETVQIESADPLRDWIRINQHPELPLSHSGAELHFSGFLSKEQYREKVLDIQDQIREGQVYEMNLCQFFSAEGPVDGMAVYRLLNRAFPMPFSGWMKFPGFEIASFSPERFLARRGNRLFSQPIKGTAPRGKTAEEDARLFDMLRHSEKDRAENLMIVDLVRNDLARVSRTGSTTVRELFGLYAFPGVIQMISTVESRLEPGVDDRMVLEATFPMGSMTGAPKTEVMNQIARLETHQRGAYSGALGEWNANGDWDFNVLIRSLFINHQTKTAGFAVGSAITIDSDPEAEWEECRVKARMMESLGKIFWERPYLYIGR